MALKRKTNLKLGRHIVKSNYSCCLYIEWCFDRRIVNIGLMTICWRCPCSR